MLNHYQLQLCRIQARLFALAYAEGYDPKQFVATFMVSRTAADLDAVFDRHQWAGERYLLEEVVEMSHLSRDDSQSLDAVSAEAIFWAGYLYRYWHFVTGESSVQIYTQAPIDVMLDVYPGMHALSPEMAIDDLKLTNNQPLAPSCGSEGGESGSMTSPTTCTTGMSRAGHP